jgi:hypothetical protein
LYEERDWQKARDADTPEAYQAFLKQYPEGKWTEEARIRVENFTLAQAPGAAAAADGPASAGAAPGADSAGKTTSPAPSPAKETPAPAAPAAATPPPKSAAGSYGVQLGAFKSGPEAAHKHWVRLQKEYPALLGGLSSKVLISKTSAGQLYRLQTRGVTEKRARQICSSLKAESQACVVVPPRQG